MNQISEVMATLIHYKVVVRDTLEYTLKKDSYNIDLFNEKKRSILIELEESTPLRSILDNSEENGKKLEKIIRDWYDQVYGENSTILRLANDGLRVDHNQHLAIFKGAIPIHENIEAMLQGIKHDAGENGLDVKMAANADEKEERLYRGVAYMTLTNELVKLFNDYNQARTEANGAETAASKFIANDIAELVGLLQQVKGNSSITDSDYKDMEDKVTALVENMTGARDLPKGETFGSVITDVQGTIARYVQAVEPEFREAYIPVIQELIKSAQENGNKIVPDKKEEKVEAVKLDEEPTEIDPHTGMPKA